MVAYEQPATKGGCIVSIETTRSLFLWCTVINFALLGVWALLATLGRGWLYGLTSRLFRVTPEQFDVLNIAGITLYKMGVLLFNLVPWISLNFIS
jgi:hypothetical protein